MTRTNDEIGRSLLLSVCVNPDCRWAMPSYSRTVLKMYEGGHVGLGSLDVPGHDVFKRIQVYENGAPEVFE